VVAEKKLGYKWVKWVTRIELTDQAYLGYWEQQGYDDKADAKR
jgi:DMSO/TMAO reductase YedYZ molybdopterin-dependent catalytic subunit